MTEHEYILATDIRSIDCALSCVQRLVPPNNPHIPVAEFVRVVETLRVWRVNMLKDVEVQ